MKIGHSTRSYTTHALYDWFLQHAKRKCRREEPLVSAKAANGVTGTKSLVESVKYAPPSPATYDALRWANYVRRRGQRCRNYKGEAREVRYRRKARYILVLFALMAIVLGARVLTQKDYQSIFRRLL